MATAIGLLVLFGWASASSADGGQASGGSATAGRGPSTKPLLGLDLKPVTGLLTPLTESAGTTIQTATKPVTSTLAPSVDAASSTVRPVVQTVGGASKPLAPMVAPVVQTVEPIVRPVLTPVVDQVVTPVLDRVVAPVVHDVVAPVVAPTLGPVTAPILEPLVGGPNAPESGPVDHLLSPIVDPMIEAVTGTPGPIGPTSSIGSDHAGTIRVSNPAADLAASDSLDFGRADGSTSTDLSALAAGPTTGAVALPEPADTVGHADDQHDSTSPSDLPTVPTPVLPDGAPCTATPSGSSGPGVVGTTPAAGSHGRSWRRLPSRSTTTAIPDGRPRPQPGFSPG